MSVGKFTSLEEVRKDPKLLKQFIRERQASGQADGNEAVFDASLASILKTSPEAGSSSSAASDADCSGTQTRPNTSANASAKPKRGSRE